MKGYPRWFSPYSKPNAPYKPQKTFEGTHTRLGTIENYESYNLSELVEQYGEDASIYIEFSEDRYDSGIENDSYVYTTAPRENPNYEAELEAYKKKYAIYKEQLAEWKVLKKK